MADNLLRIVSALNKHFGGVIATDDVNLEVEQGSHSRGYRPQRRRQDHACWRS